MRERLMIRSGNRKRFYLLLTLLLGLVLIRYSLLIPIPRPVFLGIILLILLLGDEDEILAMCLCCIPLHESIDFFYSLVFCIAVYVFKYYRKIRINVTVVPLLLMVIWELLHCLGEDFSVMGFLSNMIPLLVLAIIMSADVSGTDYAFLIRALAFSTAMVCVSLLLRVLYLANFNFVSAFANLQRLGMDAEETRKTAAIVGGQINYNTLGIICVLVTTGLMQLRTVGRGNRKDLMLAAALLIFGTLTASRTYLVCLVFMLLLLLFSQKGTVNQKLKFLGGMLLVLLLALVVLYLVFPELMEYFYSRFLEADITTGRIGTMGLYHRFIWSDPMNLAFGIGLQDFGEKVTQVYRVSRSVPHNGIQELVIAWGMPGVILFVGMLILMIWRSRKFSRRQTLLNYIPLLIILLKVQAGQMINSPYTMLVFSYSYLSLCENMGLEGIVKRGAGPYGSN